MNEVQNLQKLIHTFRNVDSTDLFHQMLQIFPLPMAIFESGGAMIFLNQACCQMWNISDPEKLIYHCNLKNDLVPNQGLEPKRFLHDIFHGLSRSIEDVQIPFIELTDKFKTSPVDSNYDVVKIYGDILCFPLWEFNNLAYIVAIFITKRIYHGNRDIARTKEYIDNHWREKYDAKEIAKTVNLSVGYLSNLFKKNTGITMFDYYKRVKIEHIKEKLLDKNLTIFEAFAACGEDSRGRSAKMFKEITGMSPKEYRTSAK